MDPASEQKIATAKQLKDTGDQSFKAGDLKKGIRPVVFAADDGSLNAFEALSFYHQVTYDAARIVAPA